MGQVFCNLAKMYIHSDKNLTFKKRDMIELGLVTNIYIFSIIETTSKLKKIILFTYIYFTMLPKL